MSFALRAKAGREQGGAFVFPEFEGWTQLKGTKFGLSKSKNKMFTLELKIIEKGDLRGKILKERVVISPTAEWQFDKFLAYLEDSGFDLNGFDDRDPDYKDIREALEELEDAGQKIKVHLVPQEEDKRYYRLTFLEVQKIGDGPGGPIVDDPADDEDPGQAPDDTAPEPEEEAPPPPPPPVRRAVTVTPTATKPAVTTPAATAAVPAKKPWQR